MLSDHPDLKTIKSYGVLAAGGTFARRSFLLIDLEGIVRAKWVVDGVVPSEPMLEAARALGKKP